VDLSGLNERERRPLLVRLVAEDARRPFDLARDSLLRVAQLRVESGQSYLLMTVHHIISDGWSLRVLRREWRTLYLGFEAGEPSALSELPIQYVDYAAWQRLWPETDRWQRHVAYWREQLAGAPAIIELPTDRPRPAVLSYRGGWHRVEVSAEMTQRLGETSRQEGVTMFMLLLASYQLLLARYSNQYDIVIGTPTAGRNCVEVESLIGCFINTLALRMTCGLRADVRQVVRHAREVVLQAQAHADVPFEQVVEELAPERSLSHTPLFHVMINWQPSFEGAGGQESGGRAAEQPGMTRFDLTLGLEQVGDQLVATFAYNRDLFDENRIMKMSRHWLTLLREMAANPEQEIRQIELLGEDERQQLLTEWNDTRRVHADDALPHEMLRAQAARYPEMVAVVCGELQLTYGELERRAVALARLLRAHGVGPENFVGLLVERSVEMIVGLYGILKAGAAYVPLDPSMPGARLELIAQETRMSVVVTQERFMESMPIQGVTPVALDTGPPRTIASAQDGGQPLGRVRPENPAYIIYTSGSTGRPKGVIIEQRQIANYTRAVTERAPFARGLSYALVQPLTVDASQTLIFPVLCTVGQLHVIPHDLAVDAPALGDYFARRAIDCLKIAPSHLAALHSSAHAARLMPKGMLFLGGEASQHEWVAGLRQLAPGCAIFNHYGPTEATVGMLMYMEQGIERHGGTPAQPIGRPLANCTTYVLDKNLQPVPAGVPGELYVGGACLARGYLNQPDVTADKFMPDALGPVPGARLYATGDLVRALPDGKLVYLGRNDHQVKVRGFRIELGEIEGALRQDGRVSEAVVVARENDVGDKRLAAYVVLAHPAEDTSAAATQLHAYLQSRLPEFMLPSSINILDALPLSAHGKVDFRKLPSPEFVSQEASDGFVAPRDSTEIQLAEIWAGLLGVERIGIRDNFFKLGGHSLLAIRLLAQVEERFGHRLPVTTMFQQGTVEHMATLLRLQVKRTLPSTVMPIQAAGHNTPFFGVHPAGGFVFCYAALAHRLGTDRPFYGLQAQGLDGKAEPHTSVEEMATEYVKAIRAVQPEGPYLLGGWSFGGVVAFEMAQQLQAQGQEVALLVMLDTIMPGWVSRVQRLFKPLTRLFVMSIFSKQLGLDAVPRTGSLLSRMTDDPDEALGRVLEQAREANLFPPDFEEAPVRRLFSMLMSQREMAWNYHPRPYTGRVALLRARAMYAPEGDDEGEGGSRLRHWLIVKPINLLMGALINKVRSLKRLARSGVEVYDVPGSHFTMVREPHVRVLAEQLRAAIEAAERHDGADDGGGASVHRAEGDDVKRTEDKRWRTG
ncbi:MAG: amino acid adenylation domain-containing protein, partial [Pyrinomonadaceae bacterium]